MALALGTLRGKRCRGDIQLWRKETGVEKWFAQLKADSGKRYAGDTMIFAEQLCVMKSEGLQARLRKDRKSSYNVGDGEEV